MSRLSYAQNGEDIVLWRALKHIENGFYIDIGACDPIEMSVTKIFYDAGWSGINIEPVKAYYERFLTERPRDINLNLAIAAQSGPISFTYIPGTGLSTTVDESARLATEHGFATEHTEVPALSMTDLLREQPTGEVHFLKIDVEGAEHAVLEGIDFTRFRPWIVVIEATIPHSAERNDHIWRDVLEAAGYECVLFDGLNLFFLAQERGDLRKALSVPANIHDGFKSLAQYQAEVSASHSSSLAEERNDEIAQLQLKLNLATADLDHARNDVKRLTRAHRSVQLEVEHTNDRARRAHAVSEQVRQELALVYASTIWRAGRPLIRIAGALPKPLRFFIRNTVKLLFLTTQPRRLAALLRRRIGGVRERPAAPIRADRASSITMDSGAEYALWIATIEAQLPPPPASIQYDPTGLPRFSVLLPGGATDALYATLRSLFAQPRPPWEVVLASTADTPALRAAFAVEPDFSNRVMFTSCTPDLDEGALLRTLLEAARAPWFIVLKPGDELTPDAFDRFSEAMDGNPRAILIHADEDELTPNRKRSRPFFKPCHSPEMLQAFNYFGRPTLIEKLAAERVGGFVVGDGAGAEWGLNLRLSDLAIADEAFVVRLPYVLCHRSFGSNGGRPDPQSSAAAAQREMLTAYWRSHGIAVPQVTTQQDGTHRSTWLLQNPPLVSIIIPSHNQSELLRGCLEGILDKTSYDQVEIVIVENNSTDSKIWQLYETFSRRPNVKIIHADGPFNYSAVCNRGAAVADGEMLLFLNNDIEIIDPNWLAELVRAALRPGVGIVGTKLVYPDGTLQHAGVAVGIHLFALMYHRADPASWGVFGSPAHIRNWLAVMGACQMVRRSVFDLIGGFDETFHIANSDVVLCLRAYKAGWRTAYTPFAGLIHHEGTTRGRQNPAEDMARSALEVYKLGIAEDPYLHPRLSSQNPVPALLAAGEPELLENLRLMGDRFIDAAPPVRWQTLNLWDDDDAGQAAGVPSYELFWLPQAARAIHDLRSAARFLIDLLRRRGDLRLRFHHALSGGAGGAFHVWLHNEGRVELDLSTEALDAVDGLFEDDFAKGVRQLYFWKDDLRSTFPLALLPVQRRAFFSWLMRFGRVEEGLSNEEIWWFLLTCAENPARELVCTYRFTPAWQERHPYGLTIFGQRKLATWLAEYYFLPPDEAWLMPEQWPQDMSPAEQIRIAYQACDRWRLAHPQALEGKPQALALIAWLASLASRLPESSRRWAAEHLSDATADELVRPGVNVLAHFCYASGLRVSAEAMTDAIASAGYLTSRRDIRTDRNDDPYHIRFGGSEIHDITVIHTQPEPFFDTVFQRCDLAGRQPRPYRIAYWYWELDTIPDYWTTIAEKVDEIWTATEFVADALRAGTGKPVHTLFPGVRIGEFIPQSRWSFGLPGREDGRFAFLFSFHMGSIMERKNPLGLIEAFKRAFRPEEKVDLILKTTSSLRHDAQLVELKNAAADANIHILDRVLAPDQILSLMDACDCYVSLHRSEGLGLTMAEAMLLEKPVIATRYSGNLDFMNDENSILIDCTLRPIDQHVPPYNIPKAQWAEPDLGQASDAMRRVFDDRELRERLARQASRDAAQLLSIEKAADRFAGRLKAIRRIAAGKESMQPGIVD